MRKCLCALLVASPWCPVAAQDAPPLAFTEARIGEIAFSLGEKPRERDIQAADTGAPSLRTPRIRVVADPIVFPPPDAGNSGPSGAVRRTLEAEFRYDPALHSASETKSAESEGGLVKMEPFRVSERRDRRAAEAIDEKQWEEDAKAFRLSSGGRLWKGSIGGYPAEAGVAAHKDLIPFFVRPEWDLITLRW